MSEKEKEAQFARMWNEASKIKREKFRNRLQSKLATRKILLTEENAKAYYLGLPLAPSTEGLYETGPTEVRGERREFRRRAGRGGRGRPGGRPGRRPPPLRRQARRLSPDFAENSEAAYEPVTEVLGRP